MRLTFFRLGLTLEANVPYLFPRHRSDQTCQNPFDDPNLCKSNNNNNNNNHNNHNNIKNLLLDQLDVPYLYPRH